MYDYFTNLHDYLKNSAKKFPTKTAIICADNTLSYQKLYQSSSQFADCLHNLGIKRDDRIVVCLGNAIQTVISFWGTLIAGAVISIIHPDTDINKLKYILQNSEASFLVCAEKHYLELQHHFTALPSLKNIFLTTGKSNNNDNKLIYFDDIINTTQHPTNPHQTQNAKCILDIDLAAIIYTSGSTGEPKGVTLTHRNMLAASTSINNYLHHQHEDIFISALPLAFDYGLYQIIMACSVGATLILEKDFIWPTQMLKKIESHQVTILPLVPTMVSLLYEHHCHFNYDLSKVRRVTNTGAALNIQHIKKLKELFPCAEIFSMYGLTECKRCTYLPPHMLDKKPKSVGIAIPNTELWIIDEQGNPLGHNQIGQLVIRGATVMRGYWGDAKATEEKLKDGLLPNEKILYTGDYCWLDEDGYLYFHGRIDETLKCRGIKVSPKEIEDFLTAANGVQEAAIIGIDDLELGAAIYAFIALNNEITNINEVEELCKNKLASEKRPKYIKQLKSLPKTSNGKIDKLALKQLAMRDCHHAA